MFFVGATGQLLTLILSICLPVVFLYSSKALALNEQNNSVSTYQKISTEVVTDIQFNFQSEIDAVCISQNSDLYTDYQIPEKIPLITCHSKPVHIFLQSSGNKAPPVFIGYSC